MYQGVLRDDERRAAKLRERQEQLEESQRKRAVYENVQKVGKES
jgi:protein PET117